MLKELIAKLAVFQKWRVEGSQETGRQEAERINKEVQKELRQEEQQVAKEDKEKQEGIEEPKSSGTL